MLFQRKRMAVQLLAESLEGYAANGKRGHAAKNGGYAAKDIVQELSGLLPELFDENNKAVALIGTSIGGMIAANQITPAEVRPAPT